MLRVGLTGGIGSGKSTVATRLAGLGAVVIDSDVLARAALAPETPGLAAVVAAFGREVLGPDGSLDRARLAGLVFTDDAARQRLNDIVHPIVGRLAADILAGAPPDAVIVHDVPLLAENGLAPAYHLVVVVEASERSRVARLTGDRGMAESDVLARIRSQAGDDDRRAVADVVLRNDGTPESLQDRVDALWRERIRPYAEQLRTGDVVESPQVRLLAYQDRWPAEYDRLAARLRHHAGPLVTEHVGSTAVPGLAAKDVIDIQIAVESMEQADQLRPALEDAGFPAVPAIRGDRPKSTEPDPDRWAKRYHRSADPGRPAHLHLRVAGGPGWRYALLVRDWLRTVPAEAAAYEAHKLRLAGEHPQRLDYTEAKEPWFDAALPRAEEWARSTGWLPAVPATPAP
ncbi:MAG: dephospho-CoA kinase [Mycobacteriales bacterium]